MKLSNNMNFSQELKKLPQIEMPENIFTGIQAELHQTHAKKHRMLSYFSIAAVLMMALVFLNQKQSIDTKDKTIEELVKRTLILEQLIIKETPQYTMEGSVITEKIVNMELWLTQLDKDIKNTKDKRKMSELMTIKLDLLENMVMLQRKINQKPDYQRVKPYII